jgi:hypothetical protein
MAIGVGSMGVQPGSAVSCTTSVLNDDNYTVGFGQTLKVNAPGLLANDTGTSLHVEVSWGAASTNPDPSDDFSLYGNASIRYGDPAGLRDRQGGFTYTPDPSTPFSGIDQFTYWAIDACGNEDVATANITVVPTVVDSTYSTPLNTNLVVPVGTGFLANDRGVDPTSMFYDFTSAHGGTVDDGGSSDGSFTYTPPPNFSGMDSFGYQVNDLNGDNTYNATVHINVAATTAGSLIAQHRSFNCDIRSRANNRVVSAELGYAGSLNGVLRARSTSVGGWEKFQCVAVGTNQWALRSRANGKYVSAELGYPGSVYATLRARSTSIGSWEADTITAVSSCTSCFALRSTANGDYASAELAYTASSYGMLRARSHSVGAWETYIITADST